EWFATFERDYRFEVHEARDFGERVLIVATHHGRGRASGAPSTLTAAWIYTVRDGKIVRCDMFGEPSEALKAVGLEELAMSQENVERLRAELERFLVGTSE